MTARNRANTAWRMGQLPQIGEQDMRSENESGPFRSEPGKGERVNIHVIDHARNTEDDIVGTFGKISGGCGPTVGEDFADTHWPIVVKVKLSVSDSDLIQHLRDLADSIENNPAPADDLEIPF